MKPIFCRLCWLSGLALLLDGCGLHYMSYAIKKPKIADLVGIYVPTPRSLQDMKQYGGPSPHRFILRPNGTFYMLNMPEVLYDQYTRRWRTSKAKLISASGTWKIVSCPNPDQSGTVWMVDFNLNKGGSFVEQEPSLLGNSPPYLIHLSFGDEDSGQSLDLEKQSP